MKVEQATVAVEFHIPDYNDMFWLVLLWSRHLRCWFLMTSVLGLSLEIGGLFLLLYL